MDSGNHDFLNISSLSAFAQAQSIETDLNQVVQENRLDIIVQDNSQAIYAQLVQAQTQFASIITWLHVDII